MADILIRGMEMPKACNECPLINCVHDNQGYYPIPEKCPLVEVPPHGRLIDADDIDTITVICNERGLLKAIDAPIIIPAESEGDNG